MVIWNDAPKMVLKLMDNVFDMYRLSGIDNDIDLKYKILRILNRWEIKDSNYVKTYPNEDVKKVDIR